MTSIFNMVSILRNNKAAEIDGVSAELLKISLPMNIFTSTEIKKQSLSRGWLSRYVNDTKVYLFRKSGDNLNINNCCSISIIPVISRVYEKIIHQRLYSFSDRKNLFHWKQFRFRSKRSTIETIT